MQSLNLKVLDFRTLLNLSQQWKPERLHCIKVTCFIWGLHSQCEARRGMSTILNNIMIVIIAIVWCEHSAAASWDNTCCGLRLLQNLGWLGHNLCLWHWCSIGPWWHSLCLWLPNCLCNHIPEMEKPWIWPWNLPKRESQQCLCVGCWQWKFTVTKLINLIGQAMCHWTVEPYNLMKMFPTFCAKKSELASRCSVQSVEAPRNIWSSWKCVSIYLQIQ